GVLVTGRLKAAVQPALHTFPQLVAVGLDDHAAAHRRIVRQVSLLHNIGIPAGKVFALRGDALLGHDRLLLHALAGAELLRESSKKKVRPINHRATDPAQPVDCTRFETYVTRGSALRRAGDRRGKRPETRR